MAAGVDPLSAEARPVLNLSGAILEGAYRLVRVIGQGGMGAVYEAVQLRLNKRVAIKIMSHDLASNTVALARFHREAEITSRLGHPHLVTVMDFGTSESGEPYLVMEMLDGEDLEVRLGKVGRLPLEATVRITRQAASALGAAHAQDIVHRDMKPANIFLLHVPGEQEFVKVLDFGISKVKAASARLTRATAVVGTPLYMSPEQTLGRVADTDHPADQWALACIAWEMISGYPPFDGDDVTTLFHRINRVDPPPLETHGDKLAPGVELVLRKALSKNGAERYPSIREFAHALETAAFGRWAEVTPPPQDVSRLVALAEASISRGPVVDAPSPGGDVGGRADPQAVGVEVAEPSDLLSTDLLRTTGASVAHAIPVWRRPKVALAGVASLGLIVAAVLLLRSSSAAYVARSAATPVLAPAIQAKVVNLQPMATTTAPPTAIFPSHASAGPKQTVVSKHTRVRANATTSSHQGGTTTTKISARRKATNAQPPRPRIFKEL
jgi:serine/threonine-protein kinase